MTAQEFVEAVNHLEGYQGEAYEAYRTGIINQLVQEKGYSEARAGQVIDDLLREARRREK